MESHKAWLSKGFEDGVFLLMGSLQPQLGGVVLAHNMSREEAEERVKQDPFVEAEVVTSEILEVDPGRATEQLQFLLG